MQIKILHAGWIRDGTWPTGAQLPISDDEPQHTEPRKVVNVPPMPPGKTVAAELQNISAAMEKPLGHDQVNEPSVEEEEEDGDKPVHTKPHR
jgi:hypothetical protein